MNCAFKKSILIICVLLVFSTVLFSFPEISVVKAEARTLVVPDDYLTISAALDGAIDGDRIFVKKGIYHQNLLIEKSISLVGEDAENTIIEGNNARPVIVVRHDDVTITAFTLRNGVGGSTIYYKALVAIHLLHANNCNISGNSLVNSGVGVWLYGASNNSIAGNSISSNNYGIIVESSDNNFIAENVVNNNGGGIRLISAAENTFRSNLMVDNRRSFSVSGDELSMFVNDVDSSNTVDAKPMCYWVGVSDRTVPSDVGCVVLVNCVGMKVHDFCFTGKYDGILLVYTHNSTVINNKIADSDTGIRLYASSNNKIIGNTITGYTGIVTGGNGTQVTNNIVNGTSVGIEMSGFNQTLAENTVAAGTFGSGANTMSCSGSYHNITKNVFSGQTYVGIVMEGSYNLFHDNIITRGETMRMSGDWNVIAKNKFNDYGIHVSGSRNIVCANRFTDGPNALGVDSDTSIYCANHIENSRLAVSMGPTDTIVFNNTLYNNNFIDSEELIKNFGSNQANFWDNGFEGNYWSDYNGTDQNNDGIGDSPYLIKSEHLDYGLGKMVTYVCGEDNRPLMNPTEILDSDKWIHVFDAGMWEWTQYEVDVVSNSIVSGFSFNPQEGASIQFNVEGETQKTGFCRVTVPKNLLSANGNWIVLVNGQHVTPVVNETAENSYIYFTYMHSKKTIEIIGAKAIPEFSPASILSLFLVVTSLAVFAYRQLLKKAKPHSY